MAGSGTTVEATERNSPGQAMRDEPRSLLDVTSEPELRGKDIGGAAGKYAKRDRGVHHSINDLVDGAIATGDDNTCCPLCEGRASNLAGGAGRGCGYR